MGFFMVVLLRLSRFAGDASPRDKGDRGDRRGASLARRAAAGQFVRGAATSPLHP